ncbi:protein BTG4 isoform X2 [Thamnophis elegans]|uniref:protein BTG4 isoform X2 n=1 Tax=Thamnophis elegans TaxID=35005 RepID=UPI001378E79F|nr:protein BTG4 isoform X2 [Thamnophis elegans]
MKDEIAATVFFITRLAKRHSKLSKQQMEKFASTLTTLLFERYKNHWYLDNPTKGQGFRCIRLNPLQAKDPLLDQACAASNVDFQSLGLPREMTIWVDPFDVCCRYGEKNPAFTVAHFTGQESDHNVSQGIWQAVEKASSSTSDYHSGTSSEEDGTTREPKSIPTVSNPNSIYQYSDPFPLWSQYSQRRCFVPDGIQPNPATAYYLHYKGYKACRPSLPFSFPRVDRYHWVSSSQ